jgi:hypothetical protein
MEANTFDISSTDESGLFITGCCCCCCKEGGGGMLGGGAFMNSHINNVNNLIYKIIKKKVPAA